MKKILLILSVFCIANPLFAQEVPLPQMPTDEEIMQTIQKFVPDKTQQEFLFKETKKKLQETYSNKELMNQVMNANSLPEIQKTNANIEALEPKKDKPKKVKKYSNHEPLSRRKKLEAQKEQEMENSLNNLLDSLE